MEYERYMKRCYELAVSAGRKGHETFGAVLVHEGKIIEEAENTADWRRGIFGHAEFNLVHRCANRHSDEVLEESVLFTSCAPCERCLAAIASLGIHTVVCGVSYRAFSRLIPSEYVPLDREGLLAKLGLRVRLIESVLEDEGMRAFEWWGRGIPLAGGADRRDGCSQAGSAQPAVRLSAAAFAALSFFQGLADGLGRRYALRGRKRGDWPAFRVFPSAGMHPFVSDPFPAFQLCPCRAGGIAPGGLRCAGKNANFG